MVAKLRSSGVLATIRKLKGLPPATTAPVPTVGAGGGKKGGKSSARCPPADCVPQTAPPGVDDTDFQRLTMFELLTSRCDDVPYSELRLAGAGPGRK